MKNIFTALLIGVGAILPLSASTLTPEQALSRFFNDKGNQTTRVASHTGSSLKLDATVGNLYVFSADNGFVILPSDDSAPSLLGFSDAGKFDLESNPELKYWMDFYNSQLDYVRHHPDVQKRLKAVEHKQRAEISPLTVTKWNQEYPYNLLCPKVDGHETVTGCVATAMAQLMKFYNYPEHGSGKHSYFWKVGEEELSFNYDSIPFQWDLMDDVYDKESSETARNAVAELMYGCGVAVDMHYSPGDSGAATMKMGASLIDIFGYSKSLWMPNREFYGYDEWEDMVYADLAKGMPVLYSGQGTAGGHQFICDGYKDDGYFHFNWGWGGLSNGYFLLTALNPADLGVGGGAGGFNSGQIASLGVKPASGSESPVYVVYNTSSFYTTVSEISAGESFNCEGQYFNFSLATLPEGTCLGMKFTSDSTEEVKFAEGPSMEGFGPDYGRNGLQVRFPELADGTYEISPALKTDGKWSAVRMPVGAPQFITAVVKDGVATIQNEKAASVFVTDVDLPADIYRDHKFPMSFTVENIGDAEFYSTVTPVLLDNQGDVVSQSTYRPVDVLTGEKETVSDYVGIFSALKNETLVPGDYVLVFRDAAGKNVSDAMNITLQLNNDSTIINVSDFKVENEEVVKDPSKVNVTMNVACESGVYFGGLQFVVFPGDGGYEIYGKTSDDMYLGAGESRSLAIEADLSDLKDGWYIATIYDGGTQKTGYVRFRIERENVGTDIMKQDPASSVIYDLNGIRMKENRPGEIQIVNGKKTLSLN